MRKIELDLIFTLLVSMAVYFIGRALVARVPLLRRFSIPAPVVGGGLMAILLAVLTGVFGTTVSFNLTLKDSLLLMFFTTVGLGADVRMLAAGGRRLLLWGKRKSRSGKVERLTKGSPDMSRQPHHRSAAPSPGALLMLWLLLASPVPAAAQHLSGAVVDTIADYVAIFALVFVPIVLITLFWMVHILPEKIAHQRGHPQADAIQTLCLLSLVFGGLLWPLAWLWAYSKPVLHKIAYGTDKHPHYEAVEHKEGEAVEPGFRDDVARLRQDVAALDDERPSVETVVRLRMELESLEERLATTGESSKER